MAGEIQPLDQSFAIVKPDGMPTEYFIWWAQQRQIDIQEGITAIQAQQLIDDWAAARDIFAGTGLDGGGPLSADVTIDLADTAVTPGVYGDATNVPQITVDQQGRITDVVDVAISGGGGGALSLFEKKDLTGLGTYTFSSIPATANHIRFILYGRSSQAILAPEPRIRVNGLTTGIYSRQRQFSISSSPASDESLSQTFLTTLGGIPGSTAPANTAGYLDVNFFEYAGTTFRKHGTFFARQPNSTTTPTAFQLSGAFEINVTSAISSIEISLASGNFVAGSFGYVYLVT